MGVSRWLWHDFGNIFFDGSRCTGYRESTFHAGLVFGVVRFDDSCKYWTLKFVDDNKMRKISWSTGKGLAVQKVLTLMLLSQMVVERRRNKWFCTYIWYDDANSRYCLTIINSVTEGMDRLDCSLNLLPGVVVSIINRGFSCTGCRASVDVLYSGFGVVLLQILSMRPPPLEW